MIEPTYINGYGQRREYPRRIDEEAHCIGLPAEEPERCAYCGLVHAEDEAPHIHANLVDDEEEDL